MACTQTLILPGTYPGLWQKDGDSRSIQGETELCGFKVSTGETAIIVPMLRSLPTQPDLHMHWPGELCSLYPVDSLGLCTTHPNSLIVRGFFHGWWAASIGPCYSLLWTTFGFSWAAHGGKWPWYALCLLLSVPRLDTGTKFESALTW